MSAAAPAAIRAATALTQNTIANASGVGTDVVAIVLEASTAAAT